MNTRFIVAILWAAILPLASPSVCGAQASIPGVGFRNLSADEARALAQGQTVFRQPTGWRNLSMPEAAPFYKELEDAVRKGGHNYLGEVILVMPAALATDAIPAITARLRDVENYAGIPYWSSRQQTYYDLFEYVRVLEGSRTPEKARIETLQYMEPFGEYQSVYEWSFDSSGLSFSGINTTALSYLYNGVRAVSPGNMAWYFKGYRHGDIWVFYGLGAVKAFDMFGLLRDRLSASFMGRIEAFFRHAYGTPFKRP